MKAKARDIGVWGEPISPIEKFIKSNFTYEWEKRFYEERPYPITGAAFEDVPFIGPLLGATIGRFVKPPKLMHEEDWIKGGPRIQGMATGDGEGMSLGNEYALYKHLPPGFGRERLTELGEILPGAPISPYGFRGVFSEQFYRITEMLGLPGFMFEATKEAATGEGQWFTQEARLESARRAYGVERDFWDRELGGGFGVGEVIRRFFPHRQRAVPLYNPIRNLMPQWLPGPGERAPDFLHGDPMTKVTMGEVRLPGPGYAALHPELEGVSPEDYPDIYKFKILADVAQYSEKFKAMRRKVRIQRSKGEWSPDEEAIYQETLAQIEAKRDRKTFDEYRYESQESLARHNEELAKQGKKPVGFFGRLIGRYWELLTHQAETPLEFLTPMAPAGKLIHMRTAIEDYERSQLYGTDLAFWQHPISHFMRPLATSTMRFAGWKGIPGHVQEVRDLEEYFDQLKYIKFTRLKQAAVEANNQEAVKEFEVKRRETLFGINPYTFNFTHIYRSLPRRERDYFKSFAAETDPEKRARILEMVPENQRSLYEARWARMRADQIHKDIKENKLEGQALTDARQELNQIHEAARAEGKPRSEKLFSEYLATKLEGESYADWYRRTQLLTEELSNRALPGPDWVGWHSGVDLNNLKLKIVENLGRDIHDFDLWPSDQQVVARQPFINKEAIEALAPENTLHPDEIRGRLRELLTSMEMENLDITVALYPSNKPEYNVNLDIAHDRSEEIMATLTRGV
jgi:hypothetical protein